MKRAYEAFLLLLIGRNWVRFISQIIEIENTLDPSYMCVLCTYMLQLYKNKNDTFTINYLQLFDDVRAKVVIPSSKIYRLSSNAESPILLMLYVKSLW